MPRHLRTLACLIALAAPAATAQVATPLALEWCTGSMPASWGFGIVPSESCRQVHVRVRSAAVLLTDARPGPGMPAGWSVRAVDEREAVASGPTPLPANVALPTMLVLATNRSTGAIDARGALPVEWAVWFADESGAPTSSGRMTASFAPVLPLREAASSGLVLVTFEGLGPAGPVEITVDNPTWYPLWLDIPTGTALSAGGRDWVVASCAPFRMMRRQKTGRTVTAFPVLPGVFSVAPRRLSWGDSPDPEDAAAARALAVAADRLQDAARAGTRAPAGPFERMSPFDFWPLALRWATWTATGTPPAELLVQQVAELLAERARAGDPAASAFDATTTAAEVEACAREIAAEADALRAGGVPMEIHEARERFR